MPLMTDQTSIEALHDACGGLPDAQKVALAVYLANSVTDTAQTGNLMRLARLADANSHDLARERFARECG